MIRYIYIFFVGLFLAIFVGMGIAVFYPQPKAPESPPYYGEQLTSDEKKQQQMFDTKQKVYEREMLVYNRNASLIALVCAVAILTIALLLSERLGVIADGLLLGGIFTLLYGIARGMATDDSKYRFLVAAIGLAITLVLGYLKFAYRRSVEASKRGGER